MRFLLITPTDGPSVKRRPSTASVGPYLAFFQILRFASYLIKSTDQQHSLSMHLRSVDAYRRSILRFSSTSGIGTISNNIDNFLGRSVNQ